MDDQLNQQELDNARLINEACAEIRRRLLRAIKELSHGKVHVEVSHVPGRVTFIRSGSETTHK